MQGKEIIWATSHQTARGHVLGLRGFEDKMSTEEARSHPQHLE